jgi:hypothetical protein
MSRSSLLATLVTVFASAAMAQVQPVLTLRFDKDFNGEGPKGKVIVGTPVDQPVLADGKSGRALKTGPKTGCVDYPTEGILNPLCGTIEMWVCPLDWLPDDRKFHTFFDARGQGALYLYKYWEGVDLLMLTCDNVQGPYASSRVSLAQWKPGQWHHLAGTWSPRGVVAYVDGKPAGKLPVEGSLPRSFDKTFRIGDQAWQLARTTASLVDEVRIYDRALAPAHVAAHFAGNYSFTVPLDRQTVQLDYKIDPVACTAEAHVDTGGADVEDARLELALAVLPQGGTFPDHPATARFGDGQAVGTLPLPKHAPGRYQVVARIARDGKQAVELARDLIIPETEWIGSDLGREDKVLPPWTPLEVHSGGQDQQTVDVACWGRAYEFQGTALPRQITSAGEALLARPVTLRLAYGDQAVRWRGRALRRGSTSPTRARLSGSADANLGKQRLRFKTRVLVEYDGLVLIELSCDKPQEVPAGNLSLEIPVKADRALYRNRWSPGWASVAGYLPREQGIVDKTSFAPFAWLGDNDRGLFWFCESDEMWPNAAGSDAIETVRSPGEVVLRLCITKGQPLPANWRFVFGLQATPVKALPRDWRKWRLQPGTNANVGIIWPAPQPDSLRYFGYPEAGDPPAFAKRVADLHAQRVNVVPYLCLSFISAACPEWPFFRKVWAMGGGDTSSSDVAAYGAEFAMASPVGRGYSDFIVWKNKQFMDRFKIDGLYHDNTHPYSSANTSAGCGYVRDGRGYPTYPILGFRALYRRMYAVMKATRPDSFSMAHMSGKVTIPILAYDDSYLDGEHFRGVVKDSYLDVLPLDTFRAEFMGRQWGIMPFFLPEFDAEHAAQVEPTRGMMALLMLHDVSPWPMWCNVGVVNQAFAALDEFGYVGSEFIPYFDATPPATTEMKDVYASAYKRADGRALVVIGNLSKEDRQGQLRIDARRLGMPLDKAVTWPEKQAVKVAGGRVQLDVPRLGYRMLVVGKREP